MSTLCYSLSLPEASGRYSELLLFHALFLPEPGNTTEKNLP